MSKPALIPAFLEPGDCVVAVSPSRRVYPAELNAFQATMKTWGLKVETGKYVHAAWYQQAGTDDQRLADMQWALDHPTARAIFATRGGYGLTKILDRLDWSGFLDNPKWLVGFSDFTPALVTAVDLGIASIHGIVPRLFGQQGNSDSIASLYSILHGKAITYKWLIGSVHNAGSTLKVEGPIIGGNLTMLANSVGTDTSLKLKGHILFLEDVNEAHYQLDRSLTQLSRAGKLEKIKAVILGQFTELRDQAADFGMDVASMVAVHLPGVPVISGFPAGHVPDNRALPFGMVAELTLGHSFAELKFPLLEKLALQS